MEWYERALTEQPEAAWLHRFLAAAYVHAGRMAKAALSFAARARSVPELTITAVRQGLPHTSAMLDRVAEGLERVGMKLS